MKALPGSSLEVVEAEFLFQLLMGLLANPSPMNKPPEEINPGLAPGMTKPPRAR